MASRNWLLTSVCGVSLAAAGFAAPPRDARGIAVVSNPATPPPGYNEGARQVAPKDTVKVGGLNPPTPVGPIGPSVPTGNGPGNGQPPPRRAIADPPPCTRLVTDGCAQTYERRIAPARQALRQDD